MPDDARLRRAHAIADEVIRVTEPPNPESLPSETLVVLAGYLQRSRRLLAAAVRLSRGGLGDVAEGLVRSILDHAVTATWMMQAPGERLAWIDRHTKRQWALIIEGYVREHGAMPPAMKREEMPVKPSREEAELPAFESRASAAGLGVWYTQFRLLSTMSHSSLIPATYVPSGRLDEPLVSLGGFMVVKLARLLDAELGEKLYARLDGLDAQLKALASEGLGAAAAAEGPRQ